MWDKIKNWLGVVAGAAIAVLLALLGIKSKQLDTSRKETQQARKETAVKAEEVKREQVASVTATQHAEKAAETAQEAEEVMEDVKAEKISYNDIINRWNAGN